MRAKIHLSVPRVLERRLKQAFKSTFPSEGYAILLGTIAGDHVAVDDLWIPDDLAAHSTPTGITIQPEWFLEATEEGRESDLIVVGDAHSHTFRKGEVVIDAVESEADLAHRECQSLAVCGILNIVQTARGLRSSLRWYGPHVEIELERTV